MIAVYISFRTTQKLSSGFSQFCFPFLPPSFLLLLLQHSRIYYLTLGGAHSLSAVTRTSRRSNQACLGLSGYGICVRTALFVLTSQSTHESRRRLAVSPYCSHAGGECSSSTEMILEPLLIEMLSHLSTCRVTLFVPQCKLCCLMGEF